MILYRKEAFQFKMLNVMLLDAPIGEDDNSVVYVSKNTYDQAVVINDRFEGERTVLCKRLGADRNDELVVFFYDNAPSPINILAPFLGLLRKEVDVPIDDIEVQYGYLHMLSQIINFNGYANVPEEARASLSIGRAVLNSYRESWKDLEQTLMEVLPMPVMTAPIATPSVVQYVQVPANQEEVVTEGEEQKDLDEIDDPDDWLAAMDAAFDKAMEEAEVEVSAKADNATVKQEPSATPVTALIDVDADTAEREAEIKKQNDELADMLAEWA